jgi:hypothetical protein
MIRRSVLIVAALFMVILIVPACNDNDETTPGVRTTGTIQGDVFDVAADQPLAGATVSITSEPFDTAPSGTMPVTITTSTGVNGTFALINVPNGFVTVVVSKDGYKTSAPQTWALTPGGVGEFTFEMAPGENPVPKFEGDEQVARPPDWEGTPGE